MNEIQEKHILMETRQAYKNTNNNTKIINKD